MSRALNGLRRDGMRHGPVLIWDQRNLGVPQLPFPITSMNANRIFERSSLGGMGWRATASSRPGRFQTRRNASPESLSREAIFEHRPGGTLTQRPGKRPWTPWNTWLTRKLLWTPRTRRRGREREPHKIGYSGDQAWVESNGSSRPGRFQTRVILIGITQPRSNFRASPWRRIPAKD